MPWYCYWTNSSKLVQEIRMWLDGRVHACETLWVQVVHTYLITEVRWAYEIFQISPDVKRIWKMQWWVQWAWSLTCWCSLLWEGHSFQHSHMVCNHSVRTPSTPSCTCHSEALPPQVCKGSHHCWGHRRSLSWKEVTLIQQDGRNMLQQRGQTRTHEDLSDLHRDQAQQSSRPRKLIQLSRCVPESKVIIF